jgi:hypothetical protein
LRAALAWIVLGCTAPTIEVATNNALPAPDRALRVETWEVFLRQHEATRAERLANVVATLAGSIDSDVLCLTGVPFDKDREALLAKQSYPHVAWLKTDRNTAIDDMRDFSGRPVTLPAGPACVATDAAALDTHLACVKKCLVDGFVDRACFLASCADTSALSPRCGACVAVQLETNTVDNARAECVEKERGEMARDGRLAAMILSRYPLDQPNVRVFPSTVERVGALTATVDKNGTRTDVVCVDAVPMFDSTAISPFAGDLRDADRGAGEQLLTRVQLLELVASRARQRPTVLLGSSLYQWEVRKTRVTASSDQLVFAGNFLPLATPDSSLCTYCPSSNKFTSLLGTPTGFPGVFDAYFHLAGARAESIDDLRTTRSDQRFTYRGGAVPATSHFGVAATVTLAQ